VLIVYGSRTGAAREPAVLLARALRSLGTKAHVRAADRIVRLGGSSLLVVACDVRGADEIAELLESFGLPGEGPPVLGLTLAPASLPPGVGPLPGTRDGGEMPRDPGASLRLASALAVAVRRLPRRAGPRDGLR
jgi:hypothetical protein